MMNVLPISVIIPTMNRQLSLKRTIEGIMSKKCIPDQIIIVDQSESIEDQRVNKEVVLKYKHEVQIDYVYQHVPSSTKARNKGIEYCKNDIIIFSDDDVDVNDETIINIYTIMCNENIAMIAGIDENMIKNVGKLGYIFNKKSFENRNIGHVTLSMFGRFPTEFSEEVETQWAMGYFFVVRRSLLQKWRLLWDEALTGYAYAEDLDFSYSYYKCAKKSNLKCIISSKVSVKHLVSLEYRIPKYQNTLNYVINREYLSYKHFSTPISRLATRWANFGDILFRILKRSAPIDMIKAQFYCDRYRKNIKQGVLNTFK